MKKVLVIMAMVFSLSVLCSAAYCGESPEEMENKYRQEKEQRKLEKKNAKIAAEQKMCPACVKTLQQEYDAPDYNECALINIFKCYIANRCTHGEIGTTDEILQEYKRIVNEEMDAIKRAGGNCK
ncbi:MAG: hypothetical protein HQL01_14245 [Nitrospirae bacterium]|nr:hypothetical protein [Nitrospirota bacterium]